jgi:hypothetical protein
VTAQQRQEGRFVVPVDEPLEQVLVGKFSGALGLDDAAENLLDVSGYGPGQASTPLGSTRLFIYIVPGGSVKSQSFLSCPGSRVAM